MGFLTDMGGALPSKAFDIWRRLYNRFDIEVGVAVGSAPEVATSIIPVTQVDELLKQARAVISEAMDLTGSGSLTVAGFTVPAGERWKLYRIFRSATTGSARVRIVDPLNDDIILTLSGTSEEIINFGEPFTLEEGWIIGMQETNNGADGAESMHALITSEEAF